MCFNFLLTAIAFLRLWRPTTNSVARPWLADRSTACGNTMALNDAKVTDFGSAVGMTAMACQAWISTAGCFLEVLLPKLLKLAKPSNWETGSERLKQ